MKCPFCGSDNTQVVDTRANLEANSVRRRRKCVSCEKRFTTYERVDLKMPRLVKKDGSRTDFDRDKLMGSMMLALRKRPVATGRFRRASIMLPISLSRSKSVRLPSFFTRRGILRSTLS